MKLVVVGAAGKMGQALIRAISASEDLLLFAAIDQKNSPANGKDAGLLAGIGKTGILISDDPLPAIAKADGIIDFTAPSATIEYAGYAAQARIAHIIGTTGLSADDEQKIKAAARHATIVKSGNMSLGVNLLSVLIEQAAQALPAEGFDIEVTEMHHRHKVDAPSGTALLLGGAAADGRNIDLATHSVRTRDGITGPRQTGTIGFSTLRGGSVIGEHSVLFAGEGETITLSHSANDRSLFANGALVAARWAGDKEPGLYSMRDVLGLESKSQSRGQK